MKTPTEAKADKPKKGPVTTKELEDRIDNLTKAVERLATNGGQGNMLKEYNLKKWTPAHKHMTKYAS